MARDSVLYGGGIEYSPSRSIDSIVCFVLDSENHCSLYIETCPNLTLTMSYVGIRFPKSVVVEGYIGVGKSTAMNTIKNMACESWLPKDKVKIEKEPVEEWENYMGSFNLIKKMYEDKGVYASRWTRAFQLKVVTDLLRQDMRIRSLLPNHLVIQERDLRSVEKVFLPQHRDTYGLVDYELLMDLAKTGIMLNEPNQKFHIYLFAEMKTCYKRVTQRGREAEERLDFDTYKELCMQMDCYLRPDADVVIDTTLMTPEEVAKQIESILRSEFVLQG